VRHFGRALAAALLLLVACRQATPAKAPDTSGPELFLLTPLPIVWSEGFGLDQPGSSALKALEREYRVKPVDLPSQLPERGLLLAVQPRALPAEELVGLDAWVRRGGRLLLLADPVLEWPSKLALGDARRPPMAFPDTGLLRHWGLRLDAPDERGPKQLTLGGITVLTGSPGNIVRLGGNCFVGERGLVARCKLGEGMVTIIADADFLNLDAGGLDGPTDGNFPALLSQIASLRR
jgi:hypothetical protein